MLCIHHFSNLDYDLVVRYEHLPQHPNQWEEATAELVRVGGDPDPDGKCANATDDKIKFKVRPQYGGGEVF